jgi:hypothetical protein
MLDKRLKRGAIVKVKSTGRIAILGAVQEVHDRYQLQSVSGWQYGVDDLEYMDNDSLISTIEGLKGEVDTLQTRFQELRKCHTCPDCKDI